MGERLDIYKRKERLSAPQNRRFVLVNVEQSLNEEPYEKTIQNRCWYHLGIACVHTTARKAGYEVIDYDENLQGYVDLPSLVTPGCIVGFGATVTGIDRLIELAREAKRLGAKYVVVGNDGPIFRTEQLLLLSDTPIDAVSTTSELRPIRELLEAIKTKELKDINIPGVAIVPSKQNRSNVASVVNAEKVLRTKLKKEGRLAPDFFELPTFNEKTREIATRNYRATFVRQHENIENVHPALAHFAQGCTRTGEGEICEYCTIADVGVVALAQKSYLKKLLELYKTLGINYVFNVTDSSYGMVHLLKQLEELDAYFSEGLVMYARAYEIAKRPELIPRWRALTGGRVVFNVGMDSGSERMLRNVNKASKPGSRLKENWQAIRNIKEGQAHLHASVIFGIAGEDKESCEETLKFIEDTNTYLGTQLSQFESDVFWFNFGSPASEVFTNYAKARRYAALAGKTISRKLWERDFYAHRDAISIPSSVQDAWYRYFTNITFEQAKAYVAKAKAIMKRNPTAAPPREFNFRPK